jgi:AcrR family transcriptional regulator
MSPEARRRPPRRRDPEAKVARLMASARELFAARGYGATTTADVARHARVSEGMVFHHFGSKAGLLEAVAADYGRGLARAMEAATRAARPEDYVEASLRAAFGYVREHGALARYLQAAPEPGEAAGARNATRAEIVASIERGLADQRGSGLMRPLDPRIAAELLFALVEAALMECFVHGDGSRESDYLREAVACVTGAVRASAGPAPKPRSP